jgi:protein involved in polysaccharide export with SLBB domain
MLVGLYCAIAVASGSIKVGDNLRITIKGVPVGEKGRIDGQYIVGESGTIRLPIVDQSLAATGLTPEVLARRIEKAYRDSQIYTTPTIEVISNAIAEPVGAMVSIGG